MANPDFLADRFWPTFTVAIQRRRLLSLGDSLEPPYKDQFRLTCFAISAALWPCASLSLIFLTFPASELFQLGTTRFLAPPSLPCWNRHFRASAICCMVSSGTGMPSRSAISRSRTMSKPTCGPYNLWLFSSATCSATAVAICRAKFDVGRVRKRAALLSRKIELLLGRPRLPFMPAGGLIVALPSPPPALSLYKCPNASSAASVFRVGRGGGTRPLTGL